MTMKQMRSNQLDELKQADNISTADYRVEILNAGFSPYIVWEFETMEEAEQQYRSLLDGGERPAFLRKYAVIPF